MFRSVLAHLAALLLDLLTARRQPEGAKDREIAVLRHQLRMRERRRPRPRIARWEKPALALLATKLRRVATGARQPWSRSLVLVTPETALRWHRDLVRRKWTFRGRHRAGRRPTDPTLAALIVRLARENPRLGFSRSSHRSSIPSRTDEYLEEAEKALCTFTLMLYYGVLKSWEDTFDLEIRDDDMRECQQNIDFYRRMIDAYRRN